MVYVQVTRQRVARQPVKIVLGDLPAATVVHPGWIATDINVLDITESSDFR
jgi:hypothetical protein